MQIYLILSKGYNRIKIIKNYMFGLEINKRNW